MSHDPGVLPEDLPVPVDDGAADHLLGLPIPSIALPATNGERVNLHGASRGRRLVIFAYPRTGRPGVESPSGWDSIPGARGCTPEACSFRDLSEQFAVQHVDIYGLSTQDSDYQLEAANRLHLPYVLLSDGNLRLTEALGLPTFSVDSMTLLRRLTLVITDERVEHVLYPVFPPDRAAADVLDVLQGPTGSR
ncbi:MAG: peroxiredoxin [Geodermatophilaceae bacterium]|nr:peroxiredoxin [Geodermatophilaceae bacterium]